MRTLIERFFNKIMQCRRVATRYGKPRPTIWPSSNSHQSEFGYALDIGDPSQPGIKQPHPAAGGDQGCAKERRFVSRMTRFRRRYRSRAPADLWRRGRSGIGAARGDRLQATQPALHPVHRLRACRARFKVRRWGARHGGSAVIDFGPK